MTGPHHALFWFTIFCYFGHCAALPKTTTPPTTPASTAETTTETTTHYYLEPPAQLPWPGWAEGITNNHLLKLSKIMIKDMKSKLDHTKSFLNKYKFAMQYELGIIASGVQTYFKHMLEIYKIHSNLHYFIRQKYSRNVLIDALAVIQGDYNQIRFERTLFYSALDRHKKLRRDRSKAIHKYSPGNPNHDEIMKRLERGQRYDPNADGPDRRRSFRGTDQLDPSLDNNVDLDDIKQPQRKTKAATGLPLEANPRKPNAKKLWKPRTSSFVKKFPVGD